MSGEFTLSKIKVVTERESAQLTGANKFCDNTDAFTKIKNTTKKTSAWDIVRAEVKDNNASDGELRSSSILAGYISANGEELLGSPLEKEFLKVNAKDFTLKGKVKKDKQEYDLFMFDKSISDGRIILPSLETDEDGKTEYYAINGKTFTKDGKEYKPKNTSIYKQIRQEFDTEHYN